MNNAQIGSKNVTDSNGPTNTKQVELQILQIL